MPIAAAIDLFRSRWASRFVDTCTIDTTTARGSFNTTTGVYGTATTAQAYSGGCLVRPARQQHRDVGEQDVLLADVAVTIPHSETDIEPGDTVTVSAAVYDSQLVGTYRVVDVEVDSWNTHRRLMCRRDMGEGHQP